MKQSGRMGTIIVILVAVALLGTMAIYNLDIERRSDADVQCKLRLKRLADAVNDYLIAHERRSFPRIINPAPRQPWDAARVGSAADVLATYLIGDPPPPEPVREAGESDAAFAERQARWRMRRQLVICPVTEQEYWYHTELLVDADPETLLTQAEEPVPYFHCQNTADGAAPHRVGGQPGRFVAAGVAEAVVVTAEGIRALEARVAELRELQQQRPSTQRAELLAEQAALLERARRAFRSDAAQPRIYGPPSGVVEFRPDAP